ncbi:hypothetical protein EJV47_08460 [Hymenobacter gummosus]|uniref:Uncharacterized protein n=1 Tax=Hymenobacter gummosus TaxID=1776032 RepID=A0A431U486_9BACT|nr:hypothetical protein [Hymenobacter gummosus]RTQ50656.1 hypothetical protein EJV47_08460 [Hymenobacter gummosus]
MHRFLLYASVPLLTQCSRCKDDPQPKTEEEKLPPATQEGKNTFGCLLNGQVWTASPPAFSPTLTAQYYGAFGREELTIRASNYRPAFDQTVYFRLRGIGSTGRYPILGGQPRYVEWRSRDMQCAFYDTLTSTQVGVVDITRLDRVQRVVSGRFAFTLRRAGCPDVQATDGRFDLRF